MAARKKQATKTIDLDSGGTGPGRELWFTLPDDKAGPAMVDTARAIETAQVPRGDQMLRQARIYSNQWLESLYDLATARLDRRIGPWNVCAAAVATAQSMVCRSGVNVTLETSGAEHSTQRLSRDATRWLYGVWGENKVASEVATSCHDDAAICDVGVAVVRVIKKRLAIERVLPNEVIVSDVEALYGARGLHQAFVKKYFPKHSVMARYGITEEKRAAILAIGTESPALGIGYEAGLIPIYEGWSVQGKHIVAVKGCTLEAEPWEYDFLPLIPMYVDRPKAGFYGRGYVQQLMGYQIQLLEINDAIDEHVRLLGAAKWVIESGSQIDPDALNNDIAGILTKAKGSASPELLIGPIVPKDLLEERQRIYDTALNEVGLNQWSVAGEEPAERSGLAMQIGRDKERGRLTTDGNNYEQWFVDLAYVCFALGDKTAGEEYSGRGPADKDLRAIDFKKIAKFLKDKPWRVKPFPISALPEEPEARRKEVEKWLEIGLITGPVALSLMELPDVDAEASLMSAAREVIMWVIEEILEKGRPGYHEPEDLMDLKLGQRMVAAAWNKARMQGVDEERLDLLHRWIVEADGLDKPAPQAQAQVEMRQGVGVAPAQVEPISLDAAGQAVAPAAAPPEATPPVAEGEPAPPEQPAEAMPPTA